MFSFQELRGAHQRMRGCYHCSEKSGNMTNTESMPSHKKMKLREKTQIKSNWLMTLTRTPHY